MKKTWAERQRDPKFLLQAKAAEVELVYADLAAAKKRIAEIEKILACVVRNADDNVGYWPGSSLAAIRGQVVERARRALGAKAKKGART